MAVELATAYIQLIPSLGGAQGTIIKELGGTGKKSGKSFSGGFSGALKPLAGLAAATFGISKITGFITDSIEAVGNWEAINAQSASAVKATGKAANVTAKQVHNLATSIEGQTATQGESIQQGANLLLTFRNIRNEAGKGNKVFDQTTLAAVDMARAMGTDVKSAALQLGKALNDPSKGLTKLTRSGVTFTASQKAQIEALQKSGNLLGAQKIILKELNQEFGGSGAAYAKTYEGALYRLNDAVGDFGESIATAAMPAILDLVKTGTKIADWAQKSGIIKDVAAGISGAFKALTGTASAVNMDPAANNAKASLLKVKGVAATTATSVTSAFSSVDPALKNAFKEIGPILTKGFTDLTAALKGAMPQLREFGVSLLPGIVSGAKILAIVLPPVATALGSVAGALAKVNGVLGGKGGGTNGLFADIITSSDKTKVAMDGLKGKYGVVIQFIGQVTTTVLGGAKNSWQNLTNYVGTSVGRLRGFINGAIGTFNRLRDGVNAAILRAVAVIATFPAKAGAALGRGGAKFFSSGASLIQKFIDGIKSKTGVVGTAVSGVVQFVKDHFPNSPAKIGPFSGRGWTALGKSGGALAEQFASGFNTSPDLAFGSLGKTAIKSTKIGAGGNTPIYTDHGVLFGMIETAANGTARLALNQQNVAAERTQRLGYQPVVFG